jgi:hypothetical protein
LVPGTAEALRHAVLLFWQRKKGRGLPPALKHMHTPRHLLKPLIQYRERRSPELAHCKVIRHLGNTAGEAPPSSPAKKGQPQLTIRRGGRNLSPKKSGTVQLYA